MVHNLKISFDGNSSTYFHLQLYCFSKAIKAFTDFVSIISELNDVGVLLRNSDYLGHGLAFQEKNLFRSTQCSMQLIFLGLS